MNGVSESHLHRLQRAFEAAPDSRVFAPLADVYRRSGRLHEALALLQQGTARHPDYLSAYVLLAECHAELGRTDEAEALLSHVLAHDPENLVALRYRARRCIQRAAFAEARVLLQQLQRIDPYDARNKDLAAEMESRSRESRADVSAPLPQPLPTPERFVPPAPVTPRFEPVRPPEPPAIDLPVIDLGRVQRTDSARVVPEPPPAPVTPPPAPPADDGWRIQRQADRIVVEPGPLRGPIRSVEKKVMAESPPAPAAGDEFSTLTLARIYESQGYLKRALVIYDDLHRKHPENLEVAERLAQVRQRIAGESSQAVESAPAPAAEPSPEQRWRLLDTEALRAEALESAHPVREATAPVQPTRLPEAGPTPPLATPGRQPEDADFERFMRYVRSLKR
jgi:tetratricopeptide (TPR) repeat protein